MKNVQNSSNLHKTSRPLSTYGDCEAYNVRTKREPVASNNNKANATHNIPREDAFKFSQVTFNPSTSFTFSVPSKSHEKYEYCSTKANRASNFSTPSKAAFTNFACAPKTNFPALKLEATQGSYYARKRRGQSAQEIKRKSIINTKCFSQSAEAVHGDTNKTERVIAEYSALNPFGKSEGIGDLSRVTCSKKCTTYNLCGDNEEKGRSKFLENRRSDILANGLEVRNTPGASKIPAEKNYLVNNSSKIPGRITLKSRSKVKVSSYPKPESASSSVCDPGRYLQAESDVNEDAVNIDNSRNITLSQLSNVPSATIDPSYQFENICKKYLNDESSLINVEFHSKLPHVIKTGESVKAYKTSKKYRILKSNYKRKRCRSACSMSCQVGSQSTLSRSQSCEPSLRREVVGNNSGSYSDSKPMPIQLKRLDKDFRKIEPTINDEMSLLELGFSADLPTHDHCKYDYPLKSSIFDIFYDKVCNYIDTNFVIHIGDEDFHCHHLVLSCYTKFFDDKMNNHEATISEDQVSKITFQSIYNWMIFYKDEIRTIITPQNILRIFKGARYLKVRGLEEQCWFFMDQEKFFSENTAFDFYIEAIRMNETHIAELMLQRISRIFLTLVGSEDYLNLQVHEICPILSSSYIAVNSELEVLLSAVRWLMHDWDIRKTHVVQVMSCIRFGLIEPQVLVIIKRSIHFPELMEILNNSDVDDMRHRGLIISVCRHWPAKSKQFNEDFEDQPEPRNFYHSKRPKHVSYNAFLLYLEAVRNTTMNNPANPKVRRPSNARRLTQNSAKEAEKVRRWPSIVDVHRNKNHRPRDSHGISTKTLSHPGSLHYHKRP